MIYTLTLNPAVDYYIGVENFIIGAVNRANYERICFGGKGINVSRVLKNLDCESIALGFIGGFTGLALEDFLTKNGIGCNFVRLAGGDTRINIKLNSTDINAAGPDITVPDLEALYLKLDNLVEDDILVLSGNVPKTMTQSIYKEIMTFLCERGVKFVVDTEGDSLLATLKYKPFLIKPNHYELGALFDTEICSTKEAFAYAQKLQVMGAQNVMVSMGGLGAILIDNEGNKYSCAAPNGKLVSAVGAGDSAVAAFLWAHQNGKDYKTCLKYAVAAGSATAFGDDLAVGEKIYEIYNEIGR